jgi:hypothetical protein
MNQFLRRVISPSPPRADALLDEALPISVASSGLLHPFSLLPSLFSLFPVPLGYFFLEKRNISVYIASAL